MKLYLLTTAGLGDFYVVASNPAAAENRLKHLLDMADYGFSDQRKVTLIRVLDEELTEFPKGKPNFTTGYKLILQDTLLEI